MIDIHPPQHAPITRREFFVHLFIVVLGILIAIGLEQSVEAIHHARERRELRAALYTESAQIVKDSHDTRQFADTLRINAAVRIAQLRAVLDKHSRPPYPIQALTGFERPNDPIWQAAKTSDSAALLSRDELTAHGELHVGCEETEKSFDKLDSASLAAEAYASRFNGSPWSADLSHASRDEILEMIERLGSFNGVVARVAGSASETGGAAEAIHNGQYDITKLYAAERSAAKRDEAAFAPRLAGALAAPSSSTQQGGSR